MLLDINLSNLYIIQWGKYNTGNNTTVYFPTTFTTFYGVTATVINSDNSGYYIINRFPRNITTSKFDHSKGTANADVTYIAVGKKS